MTSFSVDTGLDVLVSILIVIVLYNLLFVVVDLRKITRRIEKITEELETVILKPLSLTDKALRWATHMMEGKKRARGKAKKEKE